VVDVKQDVSAAIAALTTTVETANGVIENVGRDVGVLTASSVRVVEDVDSTIVAARTLVNDVRGGRGTVGRLLTDETLYERMAGISREAEMTVRAVRDSAERTRTAVDGLTARDGTIQQLAQTLRNALADVQEVTSDLAEGTEALKRNFLFRGFFRDRGFFDLGALSRDAYLSGALERDRTALRIWIDASMLFNRDAQGIERLTDAGRRRLDSAMADFVRYPRDSPLVVEGYSESTEGEAAFLRSTDRAQAVRDYLLGRFRRQTTLTDIMPMSDVAPGSPSGDNRWSGVALALFVRNDVLSAAAR
jgi:phospholipid/cholesterol/gamma-HCH transport system substrate-binding protein